jgi:hypothetical protein
MLLVPKWDVLTAEEKDPGVVNFVNVDGGTINNEPLDFVRIALAGLEGRNRRKPKEVDCATILIDPFSDPESLGPREPPSLLGLLFRLSFRWSTRRGSSQRTLRSPTHRISTAVTLLLRSDRLLPIASSHSARRRLCRAA